MPVIALSAEVLVSQQLLAEHEASPDVGVDRVVLEGEDCSSEGLPWLVEVKVGAWSGNQTCNMSQAHKLGGKSSGKCREIVYFLYFFLQLLVCFMGILRFLSIFY